MLHDIDDLRRSAPVHLSARAVAALASAGGGDDRGFDLDQYGTTGIGWINSALRPLLFWLPARPPTGRIRITYDRGNGDVSTISKQFELRDEAEPDATILAALRDAPSGASVTCVCEQTYPMVSAHGPGQRLSGPLLQALAAVESDLTIVVRHPAPISIER